MHRIDDVPLESERRVPLTVAQRELWLLTQLDERASVAYNVCSALDVHGELDTGALAQALRGVVARHAALRAGVVGEGELLGVRAAARVELALEDAAQLSDEELRARLRRASAEPFDLCVAPLLRARLLRRSAHRHVLFLASHHLVVDGVSMQVLLRELGEIYSALRAGREPALGPAPSYDEHVERQERQRESAQWRAAEAYWLDQFRQAAPALDLPADRKRPVHKTYRGGLESLQLETPLVDALRRLAADNGCTLFMVLFAAFAALSRRLSGQSDLVLGINVAGRSGRDERDALGYFTRLLPVRLQVADEPFAPAFLPRVRDVLLGALEHRDYALGDLVRARNPVRAPGRAPLVDVVFNFDRDTESFRFAGLEAGLVPVPLATAKYDLDFNVLENARGLRCDVEYASDLFELASVRRLLGLWRRLLTSVAAQPDARLGQLAWLDDHERHAVVERWNATATPVPAGSLSELLAAQARATPDAAAVLHDGGRLNHAELNARANRLARHLLAAGVGREQRVGVCLERGPDWVVAILAVWKAGGVYVPLDVAYPQERLAYMLADARASVLVTRSALLRGLPAQAARAVCLDADQALIAAQSDEDARFASAPNDLAYVMYTSGSTGTPKGAMVEHAGMLNHLWAKVADLGLTSRDVVAQNAPASFDISVWQVFAALLVGGATRVVDEEQARDATRTLGDLAGQGITVLQTVPTLLGVMLEHQGGVDLGALRLLVSHAEPLPIALCERWQAAYPHVALWNAYGPTECSDDVTHLAVRLPFLSLEYAPLGPRIQNMTLYVLDEALQPVPMGVAGELYVGGLGVGRGYLDRPALTAERFLPDPFGQRPGARLYRTGDQARHLADGTLEFLGRLDQQVKLRGLRVELPEIEAALGAHPDVLHAAVVVREDEPGDRRLVGYVVARPRVGLSAAELRSFLKARLPDFMVPSAIVPLERMPLSANEKIDRAALPRPEREPRTTTLREPRSAAERTLAEIWREVLRLERVGLDDNFFELGGHSLLAAQVIGRARKRLDVDLPLRRLFEAPTLEALARSADELRDSARPPADEVVPVPRDRPLPLSFAQQRLWFLHQFETDSALYNMLSVLRVRGPLQPALLARALCEIVARHEILRTRFVEQQGLAVQVPEAPWAVELPLRQLEGGSAAERQAALDAIIEREVRQPFDLASGRLVRALLLRVEDDEHVLLLGMHHIVGDGWSLEVFARELAVVYDALARGAGSPLPALPFQYADFAVWQRAHLSGELLQRQLAYWKSQLAELPPALELPTLGARPASPSHRGRQHTFRLSRELSAELQALSARQGVTLFITLLAAFQALLARCSGQQDLVVGGAIAGRSRGDTEGLIGFFVNALVLRADLRGRPSFATFVQRVREVVLQAEANQDVPFERLVEELQPERDMSRTPLFQVGFDLQRPTRVECASLSFSEEVFDFPLEKFDLSLRMLETEGVLSGLLLYQTDLFDDAIVGALIRQFESLLLGIVREPERPLDELPLIAPQERRRLVSQWNRTQREYPREAGLGELFEEQVRARAHEPAVVHGGTRLTYGELERRSNRLARHLRGLGVRAETRVGLCFERGVDLVVGMLSILKAGGAYVPLDPSYPSERLVYMVEDSGARLILTEEAFRGRFWETNVESVCVDELRGELSRQSVEALERVGGGGHLAYVMYTSGSTGTPKGIMVEQRAVSRLVLNSDYVELRASERVAQVSNASFDAATFEIWGALLNGATLVVIDKEIALSPTELGRTLSREGVTAMFLTTALFNQVARESRAAFGGLRHLLFGGEAVDPRAVREVTRSGHAPERLLHVYGPTETTTFATWFEVGEVDERARTIPIGRPLANTQVHVLDETLEPVPVGLPGEIYIGGPGLARGYWGRAELTAERFVPDPFGDEGGGRLYRTGDKARRRDDGALEFLGRVDDQVKLRGYRIEVGEIAAVLKQDESLADAFVLLRDDDGDRRLVAYVVAKPGRLAEAGAVKDALRARLPDYMVPAHVVVLPELPLTVNGKVDREALPVPEPESRLAEGYVAPATELEAALCGIWAEMLHVERVGTADNFFDLGGHSLLATRLVSRVRSDFGAELGLRVLFEAPTVAGLAARVADALAHSPALGPAIERVEPRVDLPLSYAQNRLWFINQLQPDSVAYNAPLHLRLSGALDAARLERCLTEIVRRHEILRTTFPARDAGPVQAIQPPRRVPVARVDLAGLAPDARHALARRLRQVDAERRFDLAHGPLLRAVLLRLDAQEHELLLGLHHIVTDGWSAPILVGELFALWEAYGAFQPSPLPEPTLQYADYAVWQQRWLEQDIQEKHLPYWRACLADVPALDLPSDRERRPVTLHPGAELLFSLPAELGERLTAWSQQAGVTLFMTLLAAFQWLLRCWAMQADVAVGTAIAHRNRKEIEGLVGFFVNALVLRTDLRGRPSFRELVARVREVTLGAFTHQDMPFERLVEELNPERDLRRSPLFQVRFTLDKQPPPLPALASLRAEELYVELPEVKFDLTMAMQDAADGTLTGCLIYAADLFERDSMRQLVAQFERLLAQVVAAPDAPLTSLSLLGEGERAHLLGTLARGASAALPEACVHELIAEQARRAPQALAVVCEGQRLSYAELQSRAHRLAHALQALGVGPEVRVGVCLTRGVDLIVALLGALVAGAAYVPIDPHNPHERLALLFDDAQIPVLLTEAGLRDRLPAQWIHTLCLDTQWPEIAAYPDHAPRSDARPDNLAYVIYTSGSTGTPKGVGVEHAQLVNYVVGVSREAGLRAGWKCAYVSSPAADLGHTVLFGALCNGGELHVIGEDRARDARALATYFREHAIDCVKITPTHLAGLQPTPELLPARLLVLGGEATSWRFARELQQLRPDCRLMNHYGPTECTVGALAWPLDESRARGAENLPLGRPLANVTAYLLDEDLQCVPAGVAGELYLGGAGVSRGYVGRAESTAERFLPDPFATRPGARLYRTGDKARFLPDGTLEFLGRVDQQVKVRGFRVELGEIEALLCQHADVGQAVALLRLDGPAPRLVAYVTPRLVGAQPHGADLRRHLKERLPEYMLPTAVIALPALPLTSSGKLDRRALPAPQEGDDAVRACAEPRNELERELCLIWADVLGQPRVGIHDDFFALGGHSLLAAQVVARIEASLGALVPLALMFSATTVAALAPEVERARGAERDESVPPLVLLDRSAYLRS